MNGAPRVTPFERACDRRLADGGAVHVRPIRASDAGALVALHGRLSDESVYLRYFSRHARLSERELAHATQVDHRDREAFVVPNRRMLQRFRDAGLAERTRFEAGVVEIELDLAPMPAA